MTLVASLAVLSACGGGGSSPSPSPNTVPVANAGPNQSVTAAALVTLNGSASSDADGTIAGYTWSQTAGTTVTLSSTTAAQPTFTAPSPAATTTLTFSLRVTDNRGGISAPATVNVTVNPTGGANAAPVANAGTAQTVNTGFVVTLDGTGSTDSDGTIASYAWTQTAGTAVTLSSTSTSQPTFTAPAVTTAATLTFSLVVTDDDGAASAASTVNVTVNPPAAGNVTGRITFVRIPFGSGTFAGLNYANPQNRPARGITVRALATGTTNVLASGVTDADGDYALNVTAGASVTIEVVAELVRTGSLPNWNVSVRDLPAAPDPIPNPLPATFTYTDGVQFAASGTSHDMLIPSGFNATGAVTGPRASGPFAILDTIYQGIELVRGADTNIDLPDLVIDWGVNNVPEDGTFFSSSPVQHIVLTADVTADTDEFDQHVIAHEFGHYIEFNFSRADNIGGSHGIGDKLDPRVAFGEGFGYAFGAIVLNDPVTRDSFVDDTLGCPNDQCSSTFNVNTNPTSTPPGSPPGNFGCWCSESSVWAILWDVFDNDGETGDTVTLGFTPIWNVLKGPERTTPAFTTIFSFIKALKDLNGSSATAINTLLAAQNINGNTLDAYGSTETNFPTPFTNVEVFPIYAAAIPTGPSDAARFEQQDRRPPTPRATSFQSPLIRFTGTGGQVTINATSTRPDDRTLTLSSIDLCHSDLQRSAKHPPLRIRKRYVRTAATSEYLIDVYDCANGCDPAEGTPATTTSRSRSIKADRSCAPSSTTYSVPPPSPAADDARRLREGTARRRSPRRARRRPNRRPTRARPGAFG
jgi:hypothetical protein